MEVFLNFFKQIQHEVSRFIIELLISFLGAFFGFLFALYLNRRADLKSKKIELYKVKQNYYDHLNHLSLMLDAITEIFQKQLDQILEHTLNIKQSPFQILSPNIHATYDLERLKDLNTDALFNAYRFFFKNQDDLDDYTKLFANADYLFRIFQEFEKQNEKHQLFIHTDQLFIRECLENISLNIGLFIKKLQLDFPTVYMNMNDFICLLPFDKKFVEITSKELDFKKLQDEFIIPLANTVLDKIEDFNFVFSVFPHIMKAKNRLISIEVNSIRYAELFLEDNANISAALKKLATMLLISSKKVVVIDNFGVVVNRFIFC